MRIDAPLLATDLAAVAGEALEIERLGYDGAFTFEGAHDPFFPLLLAAEHARNLELATAIAIAFPRSPMQLANVAHDLQVFSGGRFILGLGSQIKPHIEKRFSATWSKPAARMREMVLAVRAIWRCFNEGERLDFRGEFYRHTLMTPFFNPGPSPSGPPRVFLGGVGASMTRVAGEVADGLFVHPLNSPEFLRATTLPALREGFARAARPAGADGRPAGFEIAVQALVVTGFDADAMTQAETMTRMQLAFYGSTPQYRCVLEAHGWGELQGELNALSKQGRWMEMSGLIDDAMLDAFAIRCEPEDVPGRLHARYGAIADRVAILCHAQPHATHPAAWAEVLARCKTTRRP
jgi:probable F420-dependent oxidoreductase